MKRIQVLAVALLLIGAGKHQPPAQTTGISLAPSAWQARYSSGVQLQALSGMAGFSFLFPPPPGSANYLTTAYTTPLHEGQVITATMQVVDVSGLPIFEAPEGGTPTARLYFEQVFTSKHCRNCDATYGPDTYRWWSNPAAFTLADGTVTLVVPIDPALWSDAGGHFGDIEPFGFADALAYPAAIGLTFGGEFFGHGVNVVDGTARFILTNYAVQ